MIEFISIIVLTFALALIVLGAVTTWLERERGRLQGIALALVGLYFISNALNIPTSLKIVELLQPNHPLLQRLLRPTLPA